MLQMASQIHKEEAKVTSSLHALSHFIFRHKVIYSWQIKQSPVSAYRQSHTDVTKALCTNHHIYNRRWRLYVAPYRRCSTIKHHLCVTTGFRRDINQICSLLGPYAAYSTNSVPTFRDLRCVSPQKSADLISVYCNNVCLPSKLRLHIFFKSNYFDKNYITHQIHLSSYVARRHLRFLRKTQLHVVFRRLTAAGFGPRDKVLKTFSC